MSFVGLKKKKQQEATKLPASKFLSNLAGDIKKIQNLFGLFCNIDKLL